MADDTHAPEPSEPGPESPLPSPSSSPSPGPGSGHPARSPMPPHAGGPYSRPVGPGGPPGWQPGWPPHSPGGQVSGGPAGPMPPPGGPVEPPRPPVQAVGYQSAWNPAWGYPPARRGIAPWQLALTALVIGLIGGAVGAAVVVGADDNPSATSTTVSVPVITSSGPVAGGSKANPVVTVADKVLPSVVSIDVRGKSEEVTGSGFVYDAQGRVITNNHVIEPAAKAGTIRVILPDGSVRGATIVGRSPSYDIAVIELDNPDGLVPATLGQSSPVRVGEAVVAIGSPLGFNATVTSGIISATHRPVTTGGSGETSFINALQTDAAINPGNSGGPLVDLDGFVIGVNSAIATLGTTTGGQSGSIGVGFSIPIDQVKHTVREIIDTGHAEYPVIGAQVSLVRSLDGAEIKDVTGSSPADKAGLEVGDVVTAIDGNRVADGVELIVAIRSYEPGDVITLTVDHNGDTHKVDITLGEQVG
ncbi:MAG TPA: trypsin-like peptidase domain-containing protein [Nocardioidaceae bacterium]|nr:trypsin-like peptidase domain-containing protein [Nocardioidaceae bacterium]